MKHAFFQRLLLIAMAIALGALLIQNLRLNAIVNQMTSGRQAPTPLDHTTSSESPSFSHTDMILSGMLCPCKGCEEQSLLACTCTACADPIRREILSRMEHGERVGAVFDWFVTKFGERYLTEESRQIRKIRRP